MMRLHLETFTDQPEPASGTVEPTLTDEARLAGFDAGYAAGWDDAAAAHGEERALATAQAADALQTLAFTYQEARSHVLAAMEPLLTGMVAKLLPRIAQSALPALVVETILPLAEGLSEPPVTLHLHPDSRAAVEAACLSTPGLPVTLVEDPSLTPGEVRLTLDARETHVDLDGATASIAAAIDDFFTLETKAKAHVG